MSDVWTEIFKKYGTAAIVFAIIASLSIWGLAHWAASPGSEVSVLWGLVKYTKSGQPLEHSPHDQLSVKRIDKSKSGASSDMAKAKTTLPPITIEVQSGITEMNVQQVLQTLRSKRSLRQLSTFESGKLISELPTGTFFFTLAAWIQDHPFSNIPTIIKYLSASRFKRYHSDIELHFRSDHDIWLVGFTNETDAASISHLTGESDHKILFSPSLWGTMTSLVSVPIDRIQSSRKREIQASPDNRFDVLEVVVK